MATKTTTKAAAAPAATDDGGAQVMDPPAAPPPAAAPLAADAHPSIYDYRDVWVYAVGVARVGGATGFLTVLKTDAAAMIAAGEAVDPYTTPLPEIGARAFVPPPIPVVVAVTAFSAENPTVATAAAAAVAKLKTGDVVKIKQTAGATIVALDGMTGTVGIRSTTTFALDGIDLTAFTAVVAGVTGTATVQAS